MNTINAGALVLLGEQLVGRRVRTGASGAWPGGDGTVLELNPEPDLAFIIDTHRIGSVGIPHDTQVALLPRERRR